MDHHFQLVILYFLGHKRSSRVVELGCGQGHCTVVLADAVGDEGHIDAVDPIAPDYGKVLVSLSYFLHQSIVYLYFTYFGLN
jgi:predicted methyltransferase